MWFPSMSWKPILTEWFLHQKDYNTIWFSLSHELCRTWMNLSHDWISPHCIRPCMNLSILHSHHLAFFVWLGCMPSFHASIQCMNLSMFELDEWASLFKWDMASTFPYLMWLLILFTGMIILHSLIIIPSIWEATSHFLRSLIIIPSPEGKFIGN